MSVKTVFVVYYSLHGHIEKMARSVLKGVESSGVEAKLFQVAETLPTEVLDKMHAPPKATDVPVITAADLLKADGILFGIPTRFGMVPAQMKALMDSCGQLWMSGGLHHKFVGTFFSTGSVGGGQESTVMSTMPFFAHMGMIYVPLGYKGKKQRPEGSASGGSAWGAGTFASLSEPTDYELEVAEFQGAEFGKVVSRMSSE